MLVGALTLSLPRSLTLPRLTSHLPLSLAFGTSEVCMDDRHFEGRFCLRSRPLLAQYSALVTLEITWRGREGMQVKEEEQGGW